MDSESEDPNVGISALNLNVREAVLDCELGHLYGDLTASIPEDEVLHQAGIRSRNIVRWPFHIYTHIL